MGAAQEFEKEKLIVGIIYHDVDVYNKTLAILSEEFGPIEDMSEPYSFSKEYISGQIQPNTNFVIELYVKIANSSFDADLTGKFSLGITYFADSEEF